MDAEQGKGMLKIENLQVQVDGRPILNGINLEVSAGEVHAIMGPNGSGKSTLASVLAGREGYSVTAGKIEFMGENLVELAAEERARRGIFLGFQYPVELPGVSNLYFLKAALNAIRRYNGRGELDAMDFLDVVADKARAIGLGDGLVQRPVNVGFSGGEKKKNEIFQMAVLEPRLAILDEIDSGLDIDALKVVSEQVNRLRSPERAMILITHHQRLLEYVVPGRVHVLHSGRIVREGGRELAATLEREGYAAGNTETTVAAEGLS
jgi:Fe-S cluster assembly ATP-binding protein